MIELRQGTDVIVQLGPFVSALDGDTELTALPILSSDVLISKNGGVFDERSEQDVPIHDDGGYYYTRLTDLDTDTYGVLTLKVHIAGALYVFHDFMVVSQLYYDAKYGSSLDAFKADVSDIATVEDIMGYEIEAGFTFEQLYRLMSAALLGKSSGGSAIYRDVNDTKNRIVSTLDSEGNRLDVTLDGD